ncbi:hypothetical protein [Ramlibacter sp.]|uniref:hypothetical protein n=1 Tax=Ramlibacter sp. TaxID=1917967 RepID=UPI003D0A3EE6
MAQRSDWLPSLKDLDGVRVVVEEPVPEPFARDPLRASVEQQLRAARIRVLGMGDFPTGDPHLRISLTAATRGGLVACDLQVDFVQIVFMRRNPAVTFNRAQTWKADARIVVTESAQLADAAHEELERQVAQFIADYRTANA